MAGTQTTIASLSSSSLSSTVAPAGRWKYDVFLSFRGEDTRNNFIDHLYEALDRTEIYTFKDDKNLQRGRPISFEIMKAIEESMVAVVVFSKNYANSSWCLDELVKIIECRDLMGQRVLPVFYDVDSSDVRGQRRSFHIAFKQHEVKLIENMDKVKRWREALTIAADLSGWDVSKTANGRESECVKQIVSNILSYIKSHPTKNLIGMGSHVQDVKSFLCKVCKLSGDVCIIGIWGMGGIGNTTIARAIFHQISYEFEGSSFVVDVRKNGSNKRGLKYLQEKLLSETSQIQRRLSHKKVFLILDDVDDFKQLVFLAGAHEWFGAGSRIMITTGDEYLAIYACDLLNNTQATRLFSRYAFKANDPVKVLGQEELCEEVRRIREELFETRAYFTSRIDELQHQNQQNHVAIMSYLRRLFLRHGWICGFFFMCGGLLHFSMFIFRS